MKIRKWICCGMAAAVVLALGACGGEAAVSAEPQESRTALGPELSIEAEPPGYEETLKAKSVKAAGAENQELPGIPIDTERAEAVSVYYGSICYSLYAEDRESIGQIAELFRGFSLEEVPGGELEADTTFQIYFSTEDQQVAAINVDKNGMFYLPGDQKFYRVSEGEFRLDRLEEIYQDSMQSGGFREDQCLIR